MQGRQKIQAPAVILGGVSAPLFQFVEGPFNQVPLPVQFPVVFPRFPAVGLGQYDRFGSPNLDNILFEATTSVG